MPFLPQNVTIVGSSGQHVFRNLKKVNMKHGGESTHVIGSRIEVRPDGTKVSVPRNAQTTETSSRTT